MCRVGPEEVCYISRRVRHLRIVRVVLLTGLLLCCERSRAPRTELPNAPEEKVQAAPAAVQERAAERVARSSDASPSGLIPPAPEGSNGSERPDPAGALALRIALGELEAPRSVAPTDRTLSGDCLEPYDPAFSEYESVHQSLGFPPPDALAVMVFTPLFAEEPRVLSLHRRETGGFFVRVMRMTAAPEQRTRYERELDGSTARVFERLWSALLAGTRVDDGSRDGGCCLGPGCASFELMHGRRVGVSGLVRRSGSNLHLATDAASALARITEHPAADAEKEIALIRRKMQLTLDRVLRNDSCWMPAQTGRAAVSR